MDYIATPHLIVLNATTSEHHIPDDDPMEMTVEAIRMFLDSIAEQKAKVCTILECLLQYLKMIYRILF